MGEAGGGQKLDGQGALTAVSGGLNPQTSVNPQPAVCTHCAILINVKFVHYFTLCVDQRGRGQGVTQPPHFKWTARTVRTRYHAVELGQVSCGKQTDRCGIGCILFFVRLVLEPKSKESQSIPKIFRNVFNYIQMFVYRTWHIRSTPVAYNFTIFSTSWYRVYTGVTRV